MQQQFREDEGLQDQVVRAFIKQLGDTSVDVQGNAVGMEISLSLLFFLSFLHLFVVVWCRRRRRVVVSLGVHASTGGVWVYLSERREKKGGSKRERQASSFSFLSRREKACSHACLTLVPPSVHPSHPRPLSFFETELQT